MANRHFSTQATFTRCFYHGNRKLNRYLYTSFDESFMSRALLSIDILYSPVGSLNRSAWENLHQQVLTHELRPLSMYHSCSAVACPSYILYHFDCFSQVIHLLRCVAITQRQKRKADSVSGGCTEDFHHWNWVPVLEEH